MPSRNEEISNAKILIINYLIEMPIEDITYEFVRTFLHVIVMNRLGRCSKQIDIENLLSLLHSKLASRLLWCCAMEQRIRKSEWITILTYAVASVIILKPMWLFCFQLSTNQLYECDSVSCCETMDDSLHNTLINNF